MDTTSFPLNNFLLGEFKNHELQRSDIVLIQSKSSLFGRAIRWATRSQFTHAALIFAIPNTQQGFNRAFVIESSIGGVDLTALDDLTDYPSHKKSLVIMRLEREWFNKDIQKRIRGEMLNSIKANYDYQSIGHLVLAIGTSMLLGKRSRAVNLIKEIIRIRFRDKRLPPLRFICSGFVQFGFWHTVQNNLPDIDTNEVYFGPPVENEIGKADLLTITPEELFQSDKLVAKYLITGQRVYPVSGREQCLTLLRRAERKKLDRST
jgi:hypothetical protein